jgi:hypothetical protein
MEDVKWFSSVMLGVLAANNLAVLLGCHGFENLPSVLASSSAKETCHVQNQP